MRKNGFTIIEILAVIAIITIIGLIAIPGYHYVVNQVRTNTYENKLSLVKIAAENYAFETGLTLTNIAHLIEIGKLEADNEDGDYRNPIDHTNLLCRVVRISKKEQNYFAEITNEEVCDYQSLLLSQSKVYINRYDALGNVLFDSSGNQGWTNGSVLLELELSQDFYYPEEVTEIIWSGNNKEEVVKVNKDFESKRRLVVEASQILNETYEALVTFIHDGKKVSYQATTEVKIDHQSPSLYEEEILVSDQEKWTYNTKDLTFTMKDGNGSGIYGYAIIKNNNACHSASYTKTDKSTVTRALGPGSYYICVRDKAGNYSEEYSSYKVEIERIDSKAPNIQVEVSKIFGKENMVHFTIVDPESGVVAYSLGPDNVFEDWVLIDQTSNYTFSQAFSSNGTYYIYAKDEVGSVSKQSFKVSYVDVTAPIIKEASLISLDDFKGLNVSIQIEAIDEMPMKMCISTTGYEVGCTWEDYKPIKDYKIAGSLDGQTRTIYVTLMDGAFNKTRQEFLYEVYHECGENTYIKYGEFGSCSVSCGDGVRTRNNTIIDKITNRTCSYKEEIISCNAGSCVRTIG